MSDPALPAPAVPNPSHSNGTPSPSLDIAGASPSNDAAASQVTDARPKEYFAVLGDEKTPLSATLGAALVGLERALNMPLWLLIQDGSEHDLCAEVETKFFQARHALPQGSPVALLIESPGGSAHSAYQLGKLLRRRCGSFTAVIANWAKSAATLLALGASEIIFGDHAQLGPLDVQIFDPDRENMDSALNETQAFERLHAAGLEAIDQTMMLLLLRTGKRMDAILPHTLRFIADTMRPLLEKVDVVQYTNRLRTLKVAEEYAIRLLSPRHTPDDAKKIARTLVEKYPEHGFVIDFDEAKQIGLKVAEASAEQTKYLDQILPEIMSLNAFGRVVAE